MIINKFVVIYHLFLLCSTALGLLGAAVGLTTLTRWQPTITPESRVKLENRLYLCKSAMFLGACIRLVMIPLWFIVLHSLIPLIPGAMCLAGVHQAVPIYSWLASSMKLVLPLFYFTWIVVTLIDRKIVEQPFLTFRHFFLIPLTVFIIAEAFLDLKFLSSLQPLKVTCCTAVFDFNEGRIPEILSERHWYFVIFFCLVLVIQTVFMAVSHRKSVFHLLTVISSTILFASLPLALHTQLSPLILDAPFHHCIFCLAQTSVPALGGIFFLFSSFYLSFSSGLVGFIGHKRAGRRKVGFFLKRLKITSFAFAAIGSILLLVPTISHSILNGGGL